MFACLMFTILFICDIIKHINFYIWEDIMHKRILTLLTILSLSTALLIGCGSTQETPTQSETTTTETVEVSDGTTEEAIADTTEELVSEVSEEPASEPSEEPASEPSEEPASEPSEEPVSEPQVMYTYTDMSATMYATQTVNVRDLPCTDGEKIGSLSLNQEITVLGQCNETSWYMFDYNGQTAFVSNSYLSTEKVEVQQAPPAQSTNNDGGNSASASVPNIADYSEGVWHDMGDWMFIITSYDWGMCTNNFDAPAATMAARYPDTNILRGHGFHLNDGTNRWCFLVQIPYSTGCNNFTTTYGCTNNNCGNHKP